ncbi:hypothetical protein RM543_00980 [Roseicyclus sp. F158]|uniref:Uncharacterized protein n=1 Tax=Tropicimonas omnivorans TaxID=3075590 RepID=A0ABU3DC51_9RHOB|nr:hypothetical protein [Roseicyclus sp. F158]MDT0681240.1 hypothetical protein [Roseicyclus sp. F158]
MKRQIVLALVILAVPALAEAACYADYKAKRTDPLRLHYGVIELPESACSGGSAPGVISSRIEKDGWELLTVLGTFGEDGLKERRDSAGQYFLRY